MKSVILLPILIFLASCASGTRPQQAWPGKYSNEVLKVCWDNAKATGPEMCRNPQYIEWDHTPLIVTADLQLEPWVVTAVQAWNEIMGFELFKYVTLDTDADIIFVPGGNGGRIRGMTMFFKDGERQRAGIVMFDSAKNSMGTYLHELGHAIGLAHDKDDTRSIMYPNNGRYFPRVQVRDKRLLIERYAPRQTP